jgi:anti-sigma regulatory factor (Ser/Thr protein kinase)
MTAERQAFPARTDAWPQVSAFIEQRCAALGVGHPSMLLLLLLAEELFINTVVHGYGNDDRQRVRLAVRDCGSEVELVAEDSAREFNPFEGVSSEAPEERVGGYGRLLLVGLSSRQSYQRDGDCNRVTVGISKNRAQ